MACARDLKAILIEKSPPPGKLHDTLARRAFTVSENGSAITKFVLEVDHEKVVNCWRLIRLTAAKNAILGP
jgi:hypothetical protein